MKYAHFLLGAGALILLAMPASAQHQLEKVPPDSAVYYGVLDFDHLAPSNVTVDPEMIIRPDTSITAEIAVLVPQDSIDPEMIIPSTPHDRQTIPQLLPDPRIKDDSGDPN